MFAPVKIYQESKKSWNRTSPSRLSHELRRETGGTLRQRRAIVGLSLLAAGSMGVIALYQMGILKHLPEPPLPKLNADKVDASDEAYSHLQTPDAVLGFGSYAVTMALAAAGGKDRATRQPWLSLATAGKVLFDTFQVLRMVRDQRTKENAFCFWSLLSGAATLLSLPLALWEARTALRSSQGATV